jgi:hypothetical protein
MGRLVGFESGLGIENTQVIDSAKRSMLTKRWFRGLEPQISYTKSNRDSRKGIHGAR